MLVQASLFGLAILLIIAAIGDIRRYIIPNRLSLGIVALYPLFIWSQTLEGVGLETIPWLGSILTAFVVLIFYAALFAFGLMGGGDVKLFAAVSLWAGPGHVLEFLFIAALTGGALALLIHFRNRITSQKPSPILAGGQSGDLEDRPQTKIPYGVAIAVGGLFVVSQLIVNGFH